MLIKINNFDNLPIQSTCYNAVISVGISIIYLSLPTPEVLHVYRVDDDDVVVSVTEVVEEAFVEKYLPPNRRN